ncbi:hypothetical protein V495_07206, partial [Pseudogymnoascus sp. VKM F-4514 (FW-929)]
MFSAKLLLGSLMLLGSFADAELVARCFGCGKAAKNECVAARGQIPPHGLADGNANSNYNDVKCEVRFMPKGIATDFAAISVAAQKLIEDCCAGQTECAGVAYDTDETNDLNGGCVCMDQHALVSDMTQLTRGISGHCFNNLTFGGACTLFCVSSALTRPGLATPEIPIPEQLNQHNLNLIACKEPSGACVNSVSENQAVGSRRDELVAVLLAGHFAEFVEAEAVEDVGWGVGGRVVFRREGGGTGGAVDGLGGEGKAGIGGEGVAGG